MFLLTNKPVYWYIGNYISLTFFWDNESYSPIQLSMIHYRNHLSNNLFIVHFWWDLHAGRGRSTWEAKAAAAAISICGTPPCWSQRRDPAVPPDAGFLTVLLHQDLPIRIPFGLPLDSRCQAKKEGDRDGILAVVSFHRGIRVGGDKLGVVMRFGGSSVSLATRMEEVVGLSLSRQAIT